MAGSRDSGGDDIGLAQTRASSRALAGIRGEEDPGGPHRTGAAVDQGEALLGIAGAGASTLTTLPDVVWEGDRPRVTPRHLPRYEDLEPIGRGAMGEVTRARDNDIGRTVAIKRLRHPDASPEVYARFVEEVRTVGSLDHPNIAPIHDAGADAAGLYFVMKLLEGETLQTIIRRLAAGDREAHARWSFDRRVAVMRKVLEALRYAHGKGVIHRDLKPANIVVGPLDEVYVLDWGIARRRRQQPAAAGDGPAPPRGARVEETLPPDDGPASPDDTLPLDAPVAATASASSASSASRAASSSLETRAGALLGTPLYMSPEQARGEPLDERSDLFSFCVVFYELLTLEHPLRDAGTVAETLEAMQRLVLPLAGFRRSALQPKVPMDLSWLLRRGTHKDLGSRFQSAQQLLEVLDDRAKGKVPVECHVTAVERLGYEAMRLINRFPMGFMGLLLLAAGAAGYALLH